MTNCNKCGNPQIMYWCAECENSEEEDTCSQCGKTILEDKHYHEDCNPIIEDTEDKEIDYDIQQESKKDVDINKKINTQEEARQYAIDWQVWVADQNLSYGELAEWYEVFVKLAQRFNLGEEFKENGII